MASPRTLPAAGLLLAGLALVAAPAQGSRAPATKTPAKSAKYKTGRYFGPHGVIFDDVHNGAAGQLTLAPLPSSKLGCPPHVDPFLDYTAGVADVQVKGSLTRTAKMVTRQASAGGGILTVGGHTYVTIVTATTAARFTSPTRLAGAVVFTEVQKTDGAETARCSKTVPFSMSFLGKG